MRILRSTLALGIAAVLMAGVALAGERGTPDEAKALVVKAAAHLKDVGPEKAIADFNDPQGGYQDRDLFVFVYSAPGKILCAPGIPALVGRDATVLKDVDGKEFGKMILAAATEAGDWVEYRMTNPASKKVEPKKTYAVRSSDYVLGSGAYSQ
jgi:cytochrome c